jgi:SAM-dependent methyltransferase
MGLRRRKDAMWTDFDKTDDVSPYDLERFPHYYDLDQGDFDADIPFYLHMAQRCGAPIFELGCGSGRLLLPLAQAGYRITGVDGSPAMLDLARKKVAHAGLQETVSLVHADMRDMRLPGGYRLGFCGNNTLMHLPALNEQYAALQSAFQPLVSGGLFVLDLPNPHLSTLTEEQTPLMLDKEMVDPSTGHRILKFFSQRGDLATQVADITLIYDEMEPAGGPVRRTVVPMHMRWVYPYEARLLMEAAGFTVDDMYGSYDLEPFERRSERMILLGRKP